MTSPVRGFIVVHEAIEGRPAAETHIRVAEIAAVHAIASEFDGGLSTVRFHGGGYMRAVESAASIIKSMAEWEPATGMCIESREAQ